MSRQPDLSKALPPLVEVVEARSQDYLDGTLDMQQYKQALVVAISFTNDKVDLEKLARFIAAATRQLGTDEDIAKVRT